MLGLKKGAAEFYAHDALWASEAEKTITQLRTLFKDYACDIQHIGSTAVKKIKAKPVIDIAVGVTDIKIVEILKNKLRFNGFIYDNARSNDQRRIFFKLKYSEKDNTNLKTHNIYIVAHNCRLWLDYIIFRDYLNINEYKAREYENLKLTLNGKYKYALPSYIKAKSDFIRKTIDDNFYAMLLGKTININLDTTSSVNYPKIGDGIYPIAYGTSDSLQNQAIYIIGSYNLDYSKRFKGKIIAYISNKADNSKIWVAAKDGDIFYKPEILEAVDFQKKIDLDNIRIVCLYEKSCGAVVYTKDGGDIKFLLVRGTTNRVGFPKGHIERGETEFETALREIYEETSLNVILKSDFKEEYEYAISGFIKKKVIYFLAEFNIRDEYKIRDKQEIIEQRLISYEEADAMLRFPQDKAILKKAYEKILEK